MSTKQYTVRNIPSEVDRYLRKLAKISGKSLNQVIIDELSGKVAKKEGTLAERFDWFIGSGMDQETLDALDEAEREQKQIVRREQEKLDAITRH